jgi:hypothetical protein
VKHSLLLSALACSSEFLPLSFFFYLFFSPFLFLSPFHSLPSNPSSLPVWSARLPYLLHNNPTGYQSQARLLTFIIDTQPNLQSADFPPLIVCQSFRSYPDPRSSPSPVSILARPEFPFQMETLRSGYYHFALSAR